MTRAPEAAPRASGRGASLVLRPATAADDDFLFAVYAATRADELAVVDWSDRTKDAFLRMQYTAQSRWYRQEMPNASYSVVLLGDERVGRLYVDRRDAEIRIVDIAILPEHRGRGLGSRLLADLMAEADRTRKRLTIHVERFNRALDLYRRLGFVPVEDRGVYLFLEYRPPQPR